MITQLASRMFLGAGILSAVFLVGYVVFLLSTLWPTVMLAVGITLGLFILSIFIGIIFYPTEGEDE